MQWGGPTEKPRSFPAPTVMICIPVNSQEGGNYLKPKLTEVEFTFEGEGRVYQRVVNVSDPVPLLAETGVGGRGARKGLTHWVCKGDAWNPAQGCRPERAKFFSKRSWEKLSLQKWLRSRTTCAQYSLLSCLVCSEYLPFSSHIQERLYVSGAFCGKSRKELRSSGSLGPHSAM